MDAVKLPKAAIPKVVLPGYKESVYRSGYIRDGLVFHLDGINKGSNPDAWTDLVGGVVFNNHGATALKRGWLFENQENRPLSQYLVSQHKVAHLSMDSTIECCFIPKQQPSDRSYIVFSSNTSNAVAVGYYKDTNQFICKNCGTPSVRQAFLFNGDSAPGSPFVLSSANDVCLINGVQQTGVKAQCWTIGYDYPLIGATKIDGTTTFIGVVHSIRIYDRLLSIEEMLHNQEVDKKRFKLTI